MMQRHVIAACAIVSLMAAVGDARRLTASAYMAEEVNENASARRAPTDPPQGWLFRRAGREAEWDSNSWPQLEGEAGKALSDALEEVGVRGRQISGALPALIAALDAAKAGMKKELGAMQKRLEKMPGGDSPSAELLGLMNTYKVIFDEQWIGERSPPAIGLLDAEIREIQESEFHMTAPKLAEELLEAWRADGPKEYHDEAFDKRLEEVSHMLTYPQAKQSLSISGHLWTHLANLFMLIVRSLRDFIERKPLTWNLGAVGITGSNLCNAAAREARETFLSGAATKGARLMEFGVKWLLEKHQRVVRKLFMAMPRNKPYADDAALNAELTVAEKSLLHSWVKGFKSDYDDELNKATLNIQQFKIQRMLNVMAKGPHNAQVNKDYQLNTCSDVPGAEDRDKTPWPECKCAKDEESVYCGIEKVAERKFDATEVRSHIACTYSEPYCATQPMKHELRDLAVLLDPVPTSDCSALYDELVDSSVDQLVMFVGTEMFYMMYGTENPIRKNPDFASTMFDRLKGSKSDDFIAKAFPSIGQRQKLSAQIESKSTGISDIEEAQAYFQNAMVQGKVLIAPSDNEF